MSFKNDPTWYCPFKQQQIKRLFDVADIVHKSLRLLLLVLPNGKLGEKGKKQQLGVSWGKLLKTWLNINASLYFFGRGFLEKEEFFKF